MGEHADAVRGSDPPPERPDEGGDQPPDVDRAAEGKPRTGEEQARTNRENDPPA